jgi:cysteine desulfurase family protein (TIGR01976 family)
MPLNPSTIRSQFPALRQQAEQAHPAIFFDNPGGTQIAQQSLDRVTQYLTQHNANHGGAFRTSQESDAILEDAHAAMADFYNAASPEEVIFGNNMTTLTLYISRSISRDWKAGDTIVVTRLDHDANVTPWVLAAQDRGVTVRWVDFDVEDGTLRLDDFAAAMETKPKLVAVGYASNALGTINPVKQLIDMAHTVGAQVYIDAVQYAAHGPIDVQALGCDYLVSSSYKFFGPHAGILYGRQERLNELFAYKVRPASNDLPGRYETGTQNHEGIAGVLGAVEYLEWVGQNFGQEYASQYSQRFSGRKLALKQAMSAIQAYELEISRAVLGVLEGIPGLQIRGLADLERLDERVPTFSFTREGWEPRWLAEQLAARDIYVWDGNYYAINVTERLGVEDRGGMLRVGPVHYNTIDEVAHLKDALGGLV